MGLSQKFMDGFCDDISKGLSVQSYGTHVVPRMLQCVQS
jgi:hypothetical protein